MTLTVVSSPQCAGGIVSVPSHTDWKFYPTDNVSLQAVAQPGYAFTNWTGDVNGAADTDQDTVVVEMSRYYPAKKNLKITANFTGPRGLYALTIEGEPIEGGTVSLQTPCGEFTTDNAEPMISMEFAAGTEVTLSVACADGYRFRGWEGDLSGSRECMPILVDSSKAITARFVKSSPFPWPWVVTGAAAILVAVFAVPKLFYGRDKRLGHTPPT